MRWLRHLGLRCVTLVFALVPIHARAELTVIYDSGDTQPLAPYLQVFEPVDRVPPQSPVATPPPLGAADPEAWLPIQSTGLTPGIVQPRAIHRPFSRPFFLIGADALSRQWLVEHRDRLKSMGAVGMLVQADTLQDLRRVAQLAGGLAVLPASATDIAKALGIRHYPVLMSSHGIEQ
jgi:integrating conjugative element protein (TIGR03765 family)